MREMNRSQRTFEMAERVAEALEGCGARGAVIGAIALAVHGYPQATRDSVLATIAGDPSTTFRLVRNVLEAEGLAVDIEWPDDSDPLGGVMTVRREGFDPVQVVNFFNPSNPQRQSPGGEAVRDALESVFDGSSLRVVDLPHLVALKLYAGDRKSELDVLELLEHNPDADIERIRAVCRAFGLEERLDALVGHL